jgi:hypothetical protein
VSAYGCLFCKKSSGVLLYAVGDVWICQGCSKTLSGELHATTPKRIDDLVKLCHPDRHRGPMEALATSTTQWLLNLRRKVKPR